MIITRAQILFITIVLLQNVGAVVVEIEQGLLEGEERWTVTGDTLYSSFKGIPYAAPPIGELRFKAPQPPSSWTGTRNATVHGNVCPQFDAFADAYIPGSEDCLFLNVYTPNLNPDSPLPVMFYIHGGGYEFGSGNDDSYGPDFFMDKQNCVMVTINYRLDILGFLCLDSEEVPGNAGMKDQVAALRWVQKNIAQFGGDPNLVTIFGQSAGASACTLHALSPMSKGLFRRAIPLSGVSISEYTVEFQSRHRAFVLGKILGLDTTNTTELLEFLKTAPVNQLIDTNSSIIPIEEYIDPIVKVYYVPVIEKDFGQERFLIESPETSVKKGRMNDVDILLGYTSAEGIAAISFIEKRIIKNYKRYPTAMIPRNLVYQISPAVKIKLVDYMLKYYFGAEPISTETIPQMAEYFTDIFTYSVIRYARHLSTYNFANNLYLYEFSSVSQRNLLTEIGAKYNLTGVGHTDELQYLFQSNVLNRKVDKNDISYTMIQQACSLLTNFAIYGNPTPDNSFGVQWPKYDKKTQLYMDIGEKLIVRSKPKASMMEFWKKLYTKAGVSF